VARTLTIRRVVVASALCLVGNAASADIMIGVTLPLAGPASGLGIPMQNGFKHWSEKVAGEKFRLILLDDATDPRKGARTGAASSPKTRST
jgi:branched-chain amino acid transport system substrate-binding protein